MKRIVPSIQPAKPNLEPTLHEILDAINSTSPDTSAARNPYPTRGKREGAANTNTNTNTNTDVPVPSPACILCTLVTATVTRGIKALFAEFVNDPESRLRIRSSRGFCREHTRLVASTGDALGISILYADLAVQTTERWRRGTAGVTSRGRLIGRSRTAPCPACDLETEADARYSGALAAGLRLETVWASLKEDACLCVVHVEKVAASAKREHAEKLLSLESEKLNKLTAELNEIIRKHDYRFRNEGWGAERDAWLRALNRLNRP